MPLAAPLRAVDEVSVRRTADGWRIRARTLVDAADPHLAGHFPGAAIYPGVFVIESVRQAVGAGLGIGRGAGSRVVALDSARFLAPLVPGDVFVLDATARPDGAGLVTVAAVAVREGDDVRVAEVRLRVSTGEAGGA